MKQLELIFLWSLTAGGFLAAQDSPPGTTGNEGSSNRPAQAPDHAFEYEGHWYALFESEAPLSWDVALWECWRRGGHLVCLETQAEDEFIRDKLKNFRGACWAGGMMSHAADDDPHRLWWLNGEPMDYQNLGSVLPKKCGYYMALLEAREDRKWGFYSLSDTVLIYAFICEWPKDRSVAEEITPGYRAIRLTAAYRDGKRGAPVKIDGVVEEDEEDSRIERILLTERSSEVFKDHVVTGTSGSVVIPILREQTSLRGLMVQPLTQTRLAGKSSKLTATVFPLAGDDLAEVSYNQIIGPQMRTALTELVKFVQFQLKGWPRGKRIEISFSDKYVAKDGPSAAVACALLLDSVLTGDALDERAAVTGDLNIDGSVQAVGGIEAKVRGAAKSNCTLAVLPAGNAQQVRDYVIRNGLESLLNIPVFSAAQYHEVRPLVLAEREERIASALRAWAVVVDKLTKDPSSISTPEIRKTLDEMLEKTPNLLSAKVLIEVGNKDAALEKLSLPGSLAAIDEIIEPLRMAACDDFPIAEERRSQSAPGGGEPSMKAGQVTEIKTALAGLRPFLDHRTDDYLEAISAAITAVEKKKDWESAFKEMNRAYAELWQDPEVVESYFVP